MLSKSLPPLIISNLRGQTGEPIRAERAFALSPNVIHSLAPPDFQNVTNAKRPPSCYARWPSAISLYAERLITTRGLPTRTRRYKRFPLQEPPFCRVGASGSHCNYKCYMSLSKVFLFEIGCKITKNSSSGKKFSQKFLPISSEFRTFACKLG